MRIARRRRLTPPHASRPTRAPWAVAAVAAAVHGSCLAEAAAPAPSAAAGETSQVVVTGEKTARSLKDTASSVRVFGARELGENPGLQSLEGLMSGIGNVTSSGNNNFAPAVRGVDGTGPAQGADAFLGGTRPRLNVVVDGRTSSYNEVIFGDLGLWDTAQVEVFRGTQSLLQGRNSIAGTIVYKTNDPTFEPEFGVRALAGSRDLRELAAVVSRPLNDEWALRIAVDRQSGRSFVRGFRSYEGVDDPGEVESHMARAKLLYRSQGVPGLRSLLTLAYNDHRAPQGEEVARPFEAKVSSYPLMPVFEPRASSAVWDLDVPLGERLALENRIVYGKVKVARHAVPGDGNVQIRGHDLAVEPRLRYTGAGFKGLVGLYAFSASQRDEIDLFGGGGWDDRTRTYALYGEGTLALRSDLDLTLGARWEREERFRQGAMAMFVTDFNATYNTFLPKLGLAWRTTPDTTVGATISRGYNGGGAAFTYDEPFTNYTYKPEYVWNAEAFARSSALDGRLTFTGNVFYSRYKDMQLPFDLNPDPAIWAYVVRNAPRASTYGAELGAAWRPTEALRVAAEIGLLKTRIDRYPDSGVQGHELPRAPAATANVDVSWRAGNGLQVGASARYSTAYYSDVTNVPRGRTQPGWVANLRASYPVGPARLFAYVTNVFDSDRPVLLGTDPGAASDAGDTASLHRPRTLGVGVEAWF